ncbi:hypothetical protein [Lysinibacillus mangiferihumi]|uniref:hypothetical protein n=1 Tax=Lysinibacillus mangiferihumi TaxID=1130819 RepID=UPI001F381E6F|nr:hypothetical protein [Lysinibacillus mangiferihumi]
MNYLWEFTSIQYLDQWSDTIVELIPDNLLEFKTYEEDAFERLSKDKFLYLYKLYQNIDKSIGILVRAIYELGISHAYTVIEGYGESPFLSFSIEENRGWGNKFDGTSLSKIL